MKVSKDGEVGQMRSRSGTSRKMIRKPVSLGWLAGPEGGGEEGRGSYRQITEKMMMTTWKVKMFAMPSAMQRNMVRIPVLLSH